MLESAIKDLLEDLEDKTVYKCLVIGITDDAQIKSYPIAFYVSKQTRVGGSRL